VRENTNIDIIFPPILYFCPSLWF